MPKKKSLAKYNFNKKKIFLNAFLIIIFIWLAVGVYQHTKPLPEGISIESQIYNVSDDSISFLYDLTYINETNKVYEQEIFKNIFSMIDNANKFIVLDFFLFNKDYSGNTTLIPITQELKEKLIEKKINNPDIKIFFITDEINNFYGSYISEEISELRQAGIPVIITKSLELRDSNPGYSAPYRILLQWFPTYGKGFLPHLLGNKEKKVTLSSYLKTLNFKANHRKVIVADNNGSVYSLVTSANPHYGSSLHSNIAVLIKGNLGWDIVKSEQAVAKFSDQPFIINPIIKEQSSGTIQTQLVTEGAIKRSLLKEISLLNSSHSIDIAMFYLSDRDIVKSLLKASKKGVSIRLVLDPNKDAFGREKNGIPNRPVAQELVKKSKGKISIRWYDTNGEQFHSKMIIIRKGNVTIVFLGSANLTKRNINDFNLESNIKVIAPDSSNFSISVNGYYERIWNNEDANYTVSFEKYQENFLIKEIIYKIQESSGLSSY